MSNRSLLTSTKITATKLFQLTALSTALTLTGCGGGGGTDYFPVPDSGGDGGGTSAPSGEVIQDIGVYNVYLTSSSNNIKMEKGEKVSITVRVLEESTSGIMADKDVTFSITDPKLTGVFSNAAPIVTTDAEGKATVTLEIASNLTKEQKKHLETKGILVTATVGNDSSAKMTLTGTNEDVIVSSADYDVLLNKSNNTMKTGTDSVVLTVRVTNKQGGIEPKVPVNFSIKNPQLFGLSFDGSSKAVTDEKGLAKISLLQINTGVNSQITHTAKITVEVDGQTALRPQIEVQGTEIMNPFSSIQSLVTGSTDTFEITGKLIDGNGDFINTSSSDAKILLLNEGAQIGEPIQTNGKGEFTFKDVQPDQLVQKDGLYTFDLKLIGEQVFDANGEPKIFLDPDITNPPTEIMSKFITLAAIDQQNIAINLATETITVATPTEVTVNTIGQDGETVIVSTTKGTFANGKAADKAVIKNGKAIFTLTSIVPGAANITATILNDTADISTTNSVVISSTEPKKLLIQSVKSELAIDTSTEIIATILDKDDTPIRNAYISFSIITDGSGGQLSNSLVPTDKFGKAIISYTAGQNSTASNGVQIEATVYGVLINGVVDTTKGSDIVGVSTLLTVQTTASTISLGLSDKVIKGDRNVYYYRESSVSVNNNAGLPAKNQIVTLSLRPHVYYKGYKYFGSVDEEIATRFSSWFFTTTGREFTRYSDNYGNNTKNLDKNGKPTRYGASSPLVRCLNEDTNFNSIKDPGEDFNGDNSLQPGYLATILVDNQVISRGGKLFTISTDNEGKVDFLIRYAKADAQWMEMEMTASTKVDGSESTQVQRIQFPILVDDEDSKQTPNRISPFGVSGSCKNSE